MNTAAQDKMAKQRQKHTDDWLTPGYAYDRWRLEKSQEGKSKDQTGMLSNRPWSCWYITDKPPACDTELLQDFRTMVFRFLSHAEWRHVVCGEPEAPKPKTWLIYYWDTYLHHCTKNDRGPSYGPLWNYLSYEAKAHECFTTSAGLEPPRQKVKQWREWEDLMMRNNEVVFWDPSELLSD